MNNMKVLSQIRLTTGRKCHESMYVLCVLLLLLLASAAAARKAQPEPEQRATSASSQLIQSSSLSSSLSLSPTRLSTIMICGGGNAPRQEALLLTPTQFEAGGTGRAMGSVTP